METTSDVLTSDAPSCRDGDVVLYNVPWETYEGLLRVFGDDHPSLRLTYLEGTLQITQTSRSQERTKKVISRLLEAWAEERNIRFDGYGGATLRKREAARGLEPDECYYQRSMLQNSLSSCGRVRRIRQQQCAGTDNDCVTKNSLTSPALYPDRLLEWR